MGLGTPSLEMHIMHKVTTVNKQTKFSIFQHSEFSQQDWSFHTLFYVFRIFPVSLPKEMDGQQVGLSRKMFVYQEDGAKIKLTPACLTQGTRDSVPFLLRNNKFRFCTQLAVSFADLMRYPEAILGWDFCELKAEVKKEQCWVIGQFKWQ